jgi:hypothetical protein
MIRVFVIIALSVLSGCVGPAQQEAIKATGTSSFGEDIDFLKQHTSIIVLENATGKSKIAVSPALQGRVMTSSADGNSGNSFGWINKELFASGDTSEHINAFGGEERIWLGPEGGQFSIFFEKGKPFTLENWFTPRLIDLEPFDVIAQSKSSARFAKTAQIKNYSGTLFSIKIDREISVLDDNAAYDYLGISNPQSLKMIAFRTTNSLQNTGDSAWSKSTGLLSIWLLGMLKPTISTTVVIPFQKASVEEAGPIVNDTYFGKVPADRLAISDGVLFFKGDGEHRSKIGLSPKRAKDVLGSYDASSQTLTIVKYNKPATSDYVNSAWEIQDNPFNGDVINSYNDGPPTPGAKPMGPFYELESSSPAVELKPQDTVVHMQTTYHFQGDEQALDKVSTDVLGVSLAQIKSAFKKSNEEKQ